MENFGAYLKAHREKKGIRLEEIASITKIHPHSLELLESNKWEQLPPEPFIRGFILAYAKYVGLGTTEVLDKYREATGSLPVPEEANPETATIPGPSRARPMVGTPNELITQVRLPSGAKMITAASLVAVVGLAALLINVGRDADKPATPTVVTEVAEPVTPPVAPVIEERKVATEPAAKPTAAEKKAAKKAEKTEKSEAAPTPAAAAAPTGATAHEIVVEGKERTWMKVVVDDSPPQEIFLGEGKSATYKAANKIKVVLGNSTGSRVLYNGKEQEGTQFMGTIRSYKFPANARFPQDVPSKRTPTAGDSEKSVTE